MKKLRNRTYSWSTLNWIADNDALGYDHDGRYTMQRIDVGEPGRAIVVRADFYSLKATNMNIDDIPSCVPEIPGGGKLVASAVANVLKAEPVADFFINVNMLAGLLRDWPDHETARVMLTEDVIIISTNEIAAIMTLSYRDSSMDVLPGWLVDMAEMAIGEDSQEEDAKE